MSFIVFKEKRSPVKMSPTTFSFTVPLLFFMTAGCVRQIQPTEQQVFVCGEYGEIVVTSELNEAQSDVQEFYRHSFLILDSHGQEIGRDLITSFGKRDLEKIYHVSGDGSTYVLFDTMPSRDIHTVPNKRLGETWDSITLNENACVAVDFSNGKVSHPNATQGQSERIRKISQRGSRELTVAKRLQLIEGIARVFLGKRFDEKSLRTLNELSSLDVIVAERPFNSAEIEAIGKLPSVGCIYLNAASMSNDDVLALQRLTNIQGLCLPKKGIEIEAVQKLQAALPNTAIKQDYSD